MPSADTRVLQSIASWNGDAAVWQEWCFQIRAELLQSIAELDMRVDQYCRVDPAGVQDIKRQVKQWSLTRAELLLPLPQVGPQACGVLGKDCAMMRIAVLSFFFGAVSTLLIIGAVWRLRSRRIVKTKAVQTAVEVTEVEIQTSAVAPTESSPADTANASAVPPGSDSSERGGVASNWYVAPFSGRCVHCLRTCSGLSNASRVEVLRMTIAEVGQSNYRICKICGWIRGA
mmetsp:Transcript_13692/g.32203  ORF Transcript_13692/g.32203 Transcript_13692/m.32203 type:complete len:230 (-) Transcript_13692:252-941(-)